MQEIQEIQEDNVVDIKKIEEFEKLPFFASISYIHENCYDPYEDDSRNIKNPFEQPISMGNIGAYGSYGSALPFYRTEKLEKEYEYLKEYAKWAIDNKACTKCRFPWSRPNYFDCECGLYENNKDKIEQAVAYVETIFAYDRKALLELSMKLEADINDNRSEYAKMNHKAAAILQRKMDRLNKEKLESQQTLVDKVAKINSWKNWTRSILNIFSPAYWKYKLNKFKVGENKSIPLKNATDNTLKEMTFGGKSQNCSVKTKSGCVVVVPVSFLEKNRDKYEGSTIVSPKIRD